MVCSAGLMPPPARTGWAVHEASLAEEIAAIVERRADPGDQVLAITLEIGALAGVEREALLFALESALADTRAAGAAVHVLNLPAIARCPHCNTDQSIDIRYQPCESCGKSGLEIVQGTEMRVRSLAVGRAGAAPASALQ